MRDNNWSQSN